MQRVNNNVGTCKYLWFFTLADTFKTYYKFSVLPKIHLGNFETCYSSKFKILRYPVLGDFPVCYPFLKRCKYNLGHQIMMTGLFTLAKSSNLELGR